MQTMRISKLDISIPGYKLSYYNFFLIFVTGESVIFNSLYRCLLAFDAEETKELMNGCVPEACKDDLIANHIFVAEDMDEWRSYKDAYFHANNHPEVLTLSIMPTLSCNCACPYCFERKSAAKMTIQVEADILNWIEKQLPAYKALSVDWFGGEPLICKGAIERLSEKIISKCKDYGVQYTASITTNGVLMDDASTLSLLQRCAIHNVQITFDGDKEAHDAQKFTKNRKGTYEQLLKNVSLFCSSNPQSKLRVRINVSDANYHTIDSLLDDLSALRQHIVIFFRWVYANSAAGWKEYSGREKGNNPHKGIYELQKNAILKGFVVDDQYEKSLFRFAHCEADSQAFFTIDPLGNLYDCVHEYQPKYSIGNVRDGILKEKEAEYIAFRSADALLDEECKLCKVFPMCNGGCRRYRVNHGKHLCIDEKQNMDLYIDMLYSRYKQDQNNQ